MHSSRQLFWPNYRLYLNSTPAIDFPNIGVGGMCPLYSVYVPIPEPRNSTNIVKQVNEVNEQEGSGSKEKETKIEKTYVPLLSLSKG